MMGEEQIRDIAKDMELNRTRVVRVVGDDKLLLINKVDKNKLAYIKGNKSLAISSTYLENGLEKVLGINVTLINDINNPQNGITSLINLNDAKNVESLKGVADGIVDLYFINVSDDLTEISAKMIISDNKTSQLCLKSELEKAGV